MLIKFAGPKRQVRDFIFGQPAPNDPKLAAELVKTATEMVTIYGKGKGCVPEDGKEVCKDIGALEQILQKTRKPEEALAVWKGWHDSVGRAERDLFIKYVGIANEGARAIGFSHVASILKSGYELPEHSFAAETERLYGQVKPLYEQLHCYTRRKLNKIYGDKVVAPTGPIPVHLTGNMWAQSWVQLYKNLERASHGSEPRQPLAALERTLARSSRWPELALVLRRQADASADDPQTTEYLFRLGDLHETTLHDARAAVAAYRELFGIASAHAPARAALERLVEVLGRTARLTSSPADEKAIRVEIAQLETDGARAVSAWQAVLDLDPDDLHALSSLEAAYVRAGDWMAVSDIQTRKLSLATSTMTGLGRLYLAGEDWEKARKIYQSLVLQNVDAEAGVTKGEVYWALGKIHLQLGQPPKAKSMFQRGLELEPQNQKLKDALLSLL